MVEQMSNEKIEQVAKAISIAAHMPFDMNACERIAIASIEAMKEPTQAMLDAGAYDLDMTLEQQWQRMIEAALKDE